MPKRYYHGPASDHFDGNRFFNPSGEPPRRLLDIVRWQLSGRREPWPVLLPSPLPPDRPPQRVGEGTRLAFVGHACFLIQSGGLNILTDPVLSDRASPFAFAGPKRRNPPGIAFDDLPPIDIVLVSHNHYDHMDHRTLSWLWRRDQPRIIAPLGNDAIMRRHDPDVTVEVVDWGDELGLGPDAALRVVPANHWSARGLGDRNRALWAGFVLSLPQHRIYFAGDTGFGDGGLFRQIARAFEQIDLALLPIGAYEPRWFMAAQHMNPADAVEAFLLLNPGCAVGYHWGTFRLTDEGPIDPLKALQLAISAQGLDPQRFAAGHPGETFWMRRRAVETVEPASIGGGAG
jgi:L-ascorbate metabolism protein UlaG (beta-lactamase superfamily)